MQPASQTQTPATDKRPWILFALMCTMMLAAMDATIVSTAVPQIVGELGGFSLFSWVFSVYLLAQTVTIPIYGKLADIYGRKSVLLIGTAIFLLGSAAAAAAWDMPSLVVFRGLQGLGAGSIMATVNTLAGDLYSVKERAAVQGWLSSVWGMAAITGPLLGGFFAEYISWRWIFIVNIPVAIMSLVLISVFLHEHFEKTKHSIDYLGAMLIVIGAGVLMVWLLQSGQIWNWLSWQSAALVGIMLMTVAALFYVETRAQEPILPPWLWSRRVLSGANLAMIGMGAAMMVPEVYLPTFIQAVYGKGAIAAGLVLASMSIGWPLASSYSGRLYLRIGFRQTALIGAWLIMAAMVLFVLWPGTIPVWATVLDTILIGAGFGLLSTPLLVGIQSVVGWGKRGVVTGANMFCRYLGSSLGAAFVGAMFNISMRNQLQQAPQAMRTQLPDDIDQLISLLQHDRLSAATLAYLREGIALATSHLYLLGVVIAIIIIAVTMMTPRRFESAD